MSGIVKRGGIGRVAIAVAISVSVIGAAPTATFGAGGKPASPKLQLTPGKHGYGAIPLGTSTAAFTFTVTNKGTTASSAVSFSTSGTNAAEFHASRGATNGCVSGTTALAVGASCTIDVVFAPTAPTGKKAAKLNVADGPNAGTPAADLSGTGTTPAHLSMRPSSHDFGSVADGTTSSATTFTVTNDGAAPSGTIATAIGGPDQDQFQIGNDTCAGHTLAVGASCTFDVTFAPTSLGTKAATAQASTANSYEGVASASLSGASAATHLYWTDLVTGSDTRTTVGRSTVGGTDVNRSLVSAGFSSHQFTDVAADDHYVYWTDASTNGIGRANLDGTGADASFITGLRGPVGLTVDANHIYWANVGVTSDTARSIGRADLDGSNVNNDFIANDYGGGFVPVGNPRDVAVDGAHVYWTNQSGIGRADLDGTNANGGFIHYDGNQFIDGIAVDAGHVYWTQEDSGTYTVARADIDGSPASIDTGFISLAAPPDFMAVDVHHIYWVERYTDPNGARIGRADLDGSNVNENLVTGVNAVGLAVGLGADAPTPACTVGANNGCVTLDNVVLHLLTTTPGDPNPQYAPTAYTLSGTVSFGPTCQLGATGCEYTWPWPITGSGTFSVDDDSGNLDAGTWTATYLGGEDPPRYTDESGWTTCAAAAIRDIRVRFDFTGTSTSWPSSYVQFRTDTTTTGPYKNMVALYIPFTNPGPAGTYHTSDISGMTIDC